MIWNCLMRKFHPGWNRNRIRTFGNTGNLWKHGEPLETRGTFGNTGNLWKHREPLETQRHRGTEKRGTSDRGIAVSRGGNARGVEVKRFEGVRSVRFTIKHSHFLSPLLTASPLRIFGSVPLCLCVSKNSTCFRNPILNKLRADRVVTKRRCGSNWFVQVVLEQVDLVLGSIGHG